MVSVSFAGGVFVGRPCSEGKDSWKVCVECGALSFGINPHSGLLLRILVEVIIMCVCRVSIFCMRVDLKFTHCDRCLHWDQQAVAFKLLAGVLHAVELQPLLRYCAAVPAPASPNKELDVQYHRMTASAQDELCRWLRRIH